MKKNAVILGTILLSIQCASASDTSGALVIFPIAGAILGLVIGAVVCLRKPRKRAKWFSWPIYGVAGYVVSVVALDLQMSKNRDKVECSFGRYDHMRGGMGVITVPKDFSRSELQQFYGLLTNRENTVLSSHEFAAALVHQGNGIDQVYLNVYPDLEMPTEYIKINDEVQRQMDIVLKHHAAAVDGRK